MCVSLPEVFLQKCWMLSALAEASGGCGSFWGCRVLWNAECSEKKKNYTSDTLSRVPQISGDSLALLCLHSLTSYLWSKGDTPSFPQKSDAENE